MFFLNIMKMLSPRYLYNQYINSMTFNDILFNVISRPMEGMSVDIKPDLEITFDLNCTMNCSLQTSLWHVPVT